MQNEAVQNIPLTELFPFKNHPFRIVDDEAMQRTVESVSQFGVLSPAIARPRPKGGFEIISGHRRLHASQLLGLETIPVIVRQMDDDTAVITIVDSNLQRETMLPSERAKAYKMKMDAMAHRAGRPPLENSGQVGRNFAGKERPWHGSSFGGNTMAFFNSAITVLQTLVVALGAGLGIWGAINLLEGYGNDNPGAKSQGIKQLMAGGGVALIGTTLVPLLSGLFG